MADFCLIIPAYNEAHGIGPVLDAVADVMQASGIDHEILVIDDGSTDGTADAVKAILAQRPTVRLVTHPVNRGYGASIKTGVRTTHAPVVAITDADGTYPNEVLPDLYRRLVDEQADMVVGSRTGENVHIPLVRRPAKAFLRGLANYLSGHKIPDLNSGLRVFRREPIEENFNLVSDGFSFTTTTLLALLARNKRVVFVPIDYHKRTGSSKIRPIADTFNFIVLILRVSVYFEPLKVFLPTAGALALAGTIWGVRQIMADAGLGEAPVLLLVSALQILLVGLIADMISRKN